jgi:outer membrane protein assembly factor BamE (lipoprotein component of BamABCDE complex)
MRQQTARSLVMLYSFTILLSFIGCDRNPFSGSRLTKANYDQIKVGMSKAQVEHILGPPTTVDSKDMIIFRKTTYKYEDGKKFAIINFKNDEVERKDTNLDR